MTRRMLKHVQTLPARAKNAFKAVRNKASEEIALIGPRAEADKELKRYFEPVLEIKTDAMIPGGAVVKEIVGYTHRETGEELSIRAYKAMVRDMATWITADAARPSVNTFTR